LLFTRFKNNIFSFKGQKLFFYGDWEMQKNISVVGIVLSEDKKQVLLIKRRDVPVWVLPGGGVEEEESPEEAIIREMQEETGLTVTIERIVGEYFPINRLTRLTYLFALSPVAGSFSTGSETKEIRYFSINTLPKFLPPPYENWIYETIQNLPFTIQRKLSEITYLRLIKAFFSHPVLVLRFILSRFSLHINDKK